MSESSGQQERAGKAVQSTLDYRKTKGKTDPRKSSSQKGDESSSVGGSVQPQQNSELPLTRGPQKCDDYFMAVAFLSKLRSKDPNKQVGACIVNNDEQIVAIGYNGLPIGCSNDDFPWGREGEQEKYPYMCHAEMNAIVNRTSTSYNLKGCTIYTTLSPCVECAKLIIRSGIKEVVWAEKYKKEARETEELVKRTPSLKYSEYTCKSQMEEIEIDLKKIGNSSTPISEIPDGEKIEEDEANTPPNPKKSKLDVQQEDDDSSAPDPKQDVQPEEDDDSSAPDPKQDVQPEGTQAKEVKKRPAERIIKWEDYHMALAYLLSWPFHDEVSDTTVANKDRMGACIVNEERRIVGTGSASLLNPCGDDPSAVQGQVPDIVGRSDVCHAVMNAILNRTAASLKGCTIYSTVLPCNECAKLIIQSGIQKVVFTKLKENKDTEKEKAEKLLYHAGVCHKQYNAWPSDYKKKTKILMDLKKAEKSEDACRMVESD